MLAGEDLLARIVTVAEQMLQARGYETEVAGQPLAMVEQGTPVMRGSRAGEEIVVVIDSDDKTGIKKVRQLCEQHEGARVCIVSIDGVTPFTKRESAGVDSVSFFTARELVHNVTKHALVPPHTLLSDAEAADVKRRHCMRDSDFPSLSHTDPVARFYDFPLHSIVRIDRSGLTQDASVFYRRVVRGAT